jgi:tRNA(Ile)-lysidine synthetase-like protein
MDLINSIDNPESVKILMGSQKTFEDLYDYWFENKNIWFDSDESDDIELCKYFSHLYDSPIDNLKIKSNKKYMLGVVVLYDQVSRHLIRIDNSEKIYRWSRDVFIAQTNIISYSNSMMGYIYFSSELNPDEFAFMMLPLRHSNDYKKIVWVIDETWKRIDSIKKSAESTDLNQSRDFSQSVDLLDLFDSLNSLDSLDDQAPLEKSKNNESLEKYKKFLKATYSRAIIQADDIDYINYYSNESTYVDRKKVNNLIENFSDVLDIKFLSKHKLAKNDFDIDNYIGEIIKNSKKSQRDSDKINEIFIGEIKKYFNLEKINDCDDLTNTLNSNIEKPIGKKTDRLVLSISGGVDSMVCSWILKSYKINFCCVHINYSNRPESVKEEQFVKEWCEILGVKLWVRRIGEINRAKCMENNLRDLYETYTRDVRYKTYQHVCLNPWVILGHNRDDCFENILTNLSKKSKFDNLNGMNLYSFIDNNSQPIHFLRPMLSIEKKSIYKYAHLNNIPYLFDSTPKWSQRGKIRDSVKPTLEKWNLHIIDGIFEIAGKLTEYDQLINILVKDWVGKIKDGEIICEVSEIPLTKLFWEKIFNLSNIKISSNSLNNFIEFVKKIVGNKVKIDINVYAKYEVNKNYQIKMLKTKMNKIKIVFVKRN